MSSINILSNQRVNTPSEEPLICPVHGTSLQSQDDEPKEFAEIKELRRGLAQRHIQMIALAGTIGTGLFLGSGKAIARAGPLGALLGYTFVGILVSGVVLSIAELSALVPLSGGIIRHAEYFVDPALSFANGWNQVYSNIITIPAELVAAAIIIQFWVQINNAVWIICFGFLLVVSNLLFVQVYGELEFTCAILKIMLIVGLNIMALIITCGGGPNGETYGFRYWHDPGPFADYLGFTGALGHFMGFWTTFSNAVYAYSGVENFSLAAAETQSPRRNIPIAAKRIFFRVMLFYVLSIFMVGMIVPSNDKELLRSTGTAAQSPFVIAANNAGIKFVPSIINAVVLTSAWSAGNAAMLGGSRMLYGLGQHGHSPRAFLQTNRFDVPYIAIGFLSLFICLAFLTLSDSASIVFSWLQDFVAVSALINWMIICGVYLRFYYGCKKQGIPRSNLPWKGPFQPYAAWIALISFSILLLTGGYSVFIKDHWATETFLSSYINIPLVLSLYFGYKYKKGTQLIPLSEIPIQKFINIANDNPEPEPEEVVGWKRLNILWS
ncbi:a61c5c97-eda8-4861-a942-97df7789b8d0 [Sclerotinia trifoliorum]|uniref:A61c5c97-eda8-4861-a942-97df7789b8d0 n=1 Tax=Sclerotinia trifoliorum TaxID=28548 RepID=A0A8H2VLB6_9HELO|nr:a61c5c97-eda8-4861-a942-97df7789b8d0 [Sclerotinia trifoliorum]